MSEQINTPGINPNPVPPELEAYEKQATQAEGAALRAMATEVVHKAKDYGRAIGAMGKEVVRDASDENKDVAEIAPKGFVNYANELNADMATVLEEIGGEAIRAAAYNPEVAEAGEELRPGESGTFESWGIGDEAEEYAENYLIDPEATESLISNYREPTEEEIELFHALMEGTNREGDQNNTGEDAETEQLDTDPDGVSRQFFERNKSIFPSLSQKAENLRLAREATAKRKGNKSINAQLIRDNFTQDAIAGNWSEDEARRRWAAATYPHKLEMGSDYSSEPKLSYKDGQVSGVEFNNPDENVK